MHKTHTKSQTIKQRIKSVFSGIHPDIRTIGLSLFIFILGWGLGGDTFFSIYVDDIVENVFLISMISAILSLARMFFSITVGEEDDHTSIRSVILISKMFYIVIGILYFLAGLTGSIVLLIAAVICNGLGSASIVTSYQAFIRKHTKNGDRGRAFGIYFSAINMAYVVGAVIASLFIMYIPLPYVFLFIPVFAVISMFVDRRLPELTKTQRKKIFGKESFFHKYIRNVFSFRPIKHVVTKLKTYSSRMYYSLGFECVFNILNYIGFIFIPIVSVANNLSLAQVAIVFAAMRFPYIINVFAGDFSVQGSRRKFLFFVMLFMSFLYILLGYNESFRNILIITFGISFGLALMRPTVSAYISDCANPKEEGTISGVAEFVGKVGEILGVLIFGLLSVVFGVQSSFIIIGLLILVISIIGLIKRYQIFSTTKKGPQSGLMEKIPTPIAPVTTPTSQV